MRQVRRGTKELCDGIVKIACCCTQGLVRDVWHVRLKPCREGGQRPGCQERGMECAAGEPGNGAGREATARFDVRKEAWDMRQVRLGPGGHYSRSVNNGFVSCQGSAMGCAAGEAEMVQGECES